MGSLNLTPSTCALLNVLNRLPSVNFDVYDLSKGVVRLRNLCRFEFKGMNSGALILIWKVVGFSLSSRLVSRKGRFLFFYRWKNWSEIVSLYSYIIVLL